MSDGARTPKRKRKRRLPPLVGEGKHGFKTRFTHGIQVERGYRRMHPLSDADIAGVHRTTQSDLKSNREGHDWAFVRFYVSVEGGLYGEHILFDQDEEDLEPEYHWLSTLAVPANDPQALRDAVDSFLGKSLPGYTKDRKTWILRMETVVLKNEPRTRGKS